ncbi:hypothetical protein [Coraliomargarita parva]|uniref:hypothetical protein n=1 Tax=Coraliomargarita parva TaxID=3014050 RepID=UPI0022B3709A|nr:hypothetical protein [Coraliomargarita parva]
MNREEAQHLLQLCRPDCPDDREDPAIAEALALLEEDAELRVWFEAQQDFDRTFAGELSRIDVPDDLQGSILAGLQAHACQETTDEENFAPTAQQAWWRNPWVGIAATLAILLTLSTIQLNRQSAPQAADHPQVVAAAVPRVLEFLADRIDAISPAAMELRAPELNELTTYLSNHASPTPRHIPSGLQSMGTLGCVTYDYDGVKLSMICFKNGAVYHLITVQRSDLKEEFPASPENFEVRNHAFRVWQEDDQIYILSTKAAEGCFKRFI